MTETQCTEIPVEIEVVPEAEPVDEDPAPTDAESAPEQPCAGAPLSARIEALLMSTDRPLAEGRIGALLAVQGKGSAAAIREAIESLNELYDETGRAFRAVNVAGGWQLLTRAEFGPLLVRLKADRQQARLSQAALETLAIIAYRQPVMRAEIEAIRGVACGEVLRGLLERRLVKVAGRAEELGRPMLYGTTKQFLELFGLASPKELPEIEGLAPGRPKAAPVSEPEPEADVAADETMEAEADEPAIEPTDTTGSAD